MATNKRFIGNVEITLPKNVKAEVFFDRDAWLDARMKDVTASNIGALFGEYPYFGRLGLWELKTGRAPEVKQTRAMQRGHLFECLALDELREMFPDWEIARQIDPEYFCDPVTRVGATPDAFAVDPNRKGYGVVQIKTTVSLAKSKWFDENRQPFCPTWVALQAMTEAKLTGASWACVVLMVVDSDDPIIVIDVPIMEDVWQAILAEVALFWKAVDEGKLPEFDAEKDQAAIHRIFAQDNGEEIDLSHDNELTALLDKRLALKLAEKVGADAEKSRKVIDAQIIAKMGNAAIARLPYGLFIEAKTIKRKAYPVEPSSYRTIKIKGEAA